MLTKNLKTIIIVILITIIPNIFIGVNCMLGGSSVISILLNIILPIILVAYVNPYGEKTKNWIVNYIAIFFCCALSIFLGFIFWAYSCLEVPGGWGYNNIDKGTRGVITYEIYWAIIVISIASIHSYLSKRYIEK